MNPDTEERRIVSLRHGYSGNGLVLEAGTVCRAKRHFAGWLVEVDKESSLWMPFSARDVDVITRFVFPPESR